MLEINDKRQCNGCHACSNICPKNAIEMKTDNEGFLYPYINENLCVNCGICEKVCPILNQNHNKIKTEPIAYAACNKDEKIRLQSSSGGVFSLIAEYVIMQGGIVFGACFDNNLMLCIVMPKQKMSYPNLEVQSMCKVQ